MSLDYGAFTRTQRALLQLVRTVRNVRDEDDLQCLAFLAGELGLLRPSPFYFSRDPLREKAASHSLILRDTLRTLLSSRAIDWEHGVLRAQAELEDTLSEPATVARSASWLGALTPAERSVFARATIDLHRRGTGVLSHRAELLFRRMVAHLLGGGAGVEASERRLNTVRWQLSQA